MLLLTVATAPVATAQRFHAYRTVNAYHFQVLRQEGQLKATVDPRTRYLRIYDQSRGSGFSRTWQLPDEADLKRTYVQPGQVDDSLHVVIPKKVPPVPTFDPPADTYLERGTTIHIRSTTPVCVTQDRSIPLCHPDGTCQQGERRTSLEAYDDIVTLTVRACQYGTQSPIKTSIYNIVDNEGIEIIDELEVEEVLTQSETVSDAWKWKDRHGTYHHY